MKTRAPLDLVRDLAAVESQRVSATSGAARAPRKKFVLAALFACALTSLHTARAQTPPVATPTPKVLVYTVSAGFEHDVVKRGAQGELSLVEQALIDMGQSSRRFEAVVSRASTEFTPDNLKRYGALFFYTTGELPLDAAQREALLDFVRKGGGFVGVHSATDTLYTVPEYGAMIGAYFDNHPWHQKVLVKVEQRAHPAMRHLDASFEIQDEIYQFKAPYDRAQLNVLASLDTSSVDLTNPLVHRTDGDFALAWTKSHQRGRVFYSALGHRAEVWADPRYRQHLIGGLRWALRDDKALESEDQAPAPSPKHADVRAFVTTHPGDAARGYAQFQRVTGPMCTRCHAVWGKGGSAGPDLSDIGKRMSLDELLTSVLEPSVRIDDAWRTIGFELRDGTFVAGRIAREDAATIDYFDASGERKSLAVADVAARRASAVSLMPEGLSELLTREELADVIAYLRTLKGA